MTLPANTVFNSLANGLLLLITCNVLAAPPTADMVWIEPGTFLMGNNKGHTHTPTGRFESMPEERHIHAVTLDGFWIDQYEVTNEQFSRFVKETEYLTVAERIPKKEWFPPDFPEDEMVVGSAVFAQSKRITNKRDISQWWQFIKGANWRHPQGPGSDIKNIMDHPVVQVTHEDATAYASWAGKQLPTEAQWEYAARGGLSEQPYSWGKTFRPKNKWMANTWQGQFPVINTPEDGYLGTAPVGSYPANGYGLFDMAGNVWEIANDHYRATHAQASTSNPTGPSSSFDPAESGTAKHVIKGGSFLCTPTYCMRYRPSARQPQDYTMGTSHIGFRTVIK